jgi:hypothetical protein
MKSKVLRVSVVTKLARLFLAIGVLLSSAVAFGGDTGDKEESRFGWDLVNYDASTNTLVPGGVNSSKASDGSMITLKGSGTFVVPKNGKPSSDKPSSDVSGGGTWTITDPSGTQTGSGNYRVEQLVRFDERPFALLTGVNVFFGDVRDARGGLVFLTVAFDDGTHGVLVVSCNLAGQAIDFEGITASKGPVYYWNQQRPPVGNILHVIKGED